MVGRLLILLLLLAMPSWSAPIQPPFKVDVPPGWTVSKSARGEWDIRPKDTQSGMTISIRIEPLQGRTVRAVAAQVRKQLEASPQMHEVQTFEKAVVSGRNAVAMNSIGPCVSLPDGMFRAALRTTVFSIGDTAYIVHGGGDSTQFEAFLPTYMQVLKSIRP